MADPLKFGNAGNPFGDSSPDLSGFNAQFPDLDLSGFDASKGPPLAPAGEYVCKIERGELGPSSKGKPSYKLRVSIAAPAEYAGLSVWRTWTLTDESGRPSRAKLYKCACDVAPLGLLTPDELRRPFPCVGQSVFARVLVAIDPPQNGYPAKNGIERIIGLCDPPAGAVPPPNPFAVGIDTKEGGTQ